MIRKFRITTRSVLNDPRSLVVQALAFEGFTHAVCARYTGMSVGQVGYRLRLIGISTQGVRAGVTDEAIKRIRAIVGRNGVVVPRMRVHKAAVARR